jgi:hypothetical protein
LHQIVDGHGSGPHFRSVDRAEAARGHTRLAAWQSLFYRNVRLVETTRDDYPPRLVVKSA